MRPKQNGRFNLSLNKNIVWQIPAYSTVGMPVMSLANPLDFPARHSKLRSDGTPLYFDPVYSLYAGAGYCSIGNPQFILPRNYFTV